MGTGYRRTGCMGTGYRRTGCMGRGIAGLGVWGLGITGLGVWGLGITGLGVWGLGIAGLGVWGLGIAGPGIWGLGIAGLGIIARFSSASQPTKFTARYSEVLCNNRELCLLWGHYHCLECISTAAAFSRVNSLSVTLGNSRSFQAYFSI